MQLRRTVQFSVGGVWGDEPDGIHDLPVVRVADFDMACLRTSPIIPTWRAVAPAQRGRRLLRPGDLLLEKSGGGEQQNVGRAVQWVDSEPAICSNFINVVRPVPSWDSRFLTYLHRSLYVTGWPNACTKQTTGIQNLDVDAYLRATLPQLPLDEQQARARFLDQEWARINDARTRLERTIAAADKYEAARTLELVTRGVDRAEPVKDVDLAWASRARPEWELRKLKTLVRMRSGEGITAEQLSDEGVYPVYGGNGVRGRHDAFTHEGRFMLVGRQGALCGNVHEASGRFWASEHAVVVSPLVDLDLSWLRGLLTAMRLNQFSEAAAQPGLAVERILNLRVPVPKHAEQKAIGSALNALSATETVRRHANRISTELLAYRDAVTVEVVAGKMSATRASQRQMDERLHAAAEGRLDEVAV